MIAYHEISPSKQATVLQTGIKRSNTGAKSQKPIVAQANQLLDSLCPPHLSHAGVSRTRNTYAYVSSGEQGEVIIDITDGSPLLLQEFTAGRDTRLLRLAVNPAQCYVSDLDRYDKVADALAAHISQGDLERLAENYWNNVIPLSEFTVGTIPRPEIMVTYDIPPSAIEPVA